MAQELDDVSGATVALSAVALAALLCLRQFVPILPAALIVVVVAIGVSWAFDLGDHGIALVGPVEGGLPRPTFQPRRSATSSRSCLPPPVSSSCRSRTRSSRRGRSRESGGSTSERRRSF